MDEELVLIETIETIEEAQEEGVVSQDSVNVETLEGDTGIAEFDSELDNDSSMEETTLDVLDVETVEEIEIEVDEAVGWVPGDSSRHYSLYGRDEDNQHPISAITGLRTELDEINRLKTVYSDGVNVANYYEWHDNKAYDEYGYFVSIVPDSSNIKICTGPDIFGVTVSSAGFIGGQSVTAPKGSSYGLIVTSGVVDVRCELGINVGDCVVSNAYGYAKKADSNYGYKVLARANKNGVEYAVIALGAQADVTNELGIELAGIQDQVDANYKNIISAVNVANRAYNKVTDISESNQKMSEKVDVAVGKVDKMETNISNMETQIENVSVISTQAKAIAESAATSAASMKTEAINAANDAASKVGELTKTLDPLTTWTDPETGNSGASYLANYIDNGLATKAEIEAAEEDLEYAKSAIIKNAKSLCSLVVSIDKYSVGEYSTAHGLTLDQAENILEDDIIYVPTTSHKEKYSYVDGEDTCEYEREFTPGYLYLWGLLPSGRYGWITVDKFYSKITDINTSAPSVYFSSYEITIGANDDYGYWYTNSETIYDVDGSVTDEYEPYTLYKWEDGSWFAVATLKGNVNNRTISQIRQRANEVALEVTNARGSAATLGTRITNTESEVHTLAAWTKDEEGNQYNLATIKQTADEAGADIALVVAEKDGEKVVNAASIVAAINDGESSVGINADKIVMTGTTTFLKPDDVGENGSTVINGSLITTGELDAKKVKVINLQASSIIVAGSGGNQTVNDALANTLVSSTIYYALSTSTKTPPEDDAWSEEAPEKERKKYMWQKTVNVYGDGSSEERVVCIAGADGEGAIVVDITSSTGTVYVNSDIKTTLVAKAYQDNEDITNEFPDSAFLWEKYDMYGTKDTVWSYTGKTVAVSNLDIYKRAMFNCVLDVEQRIETEE